MLVGSRRHHRRFWIILAAGLAVALVLTVGFAFWQQLLFEPPPKDDQQGEGRSVSRFLRGEEAPEYERATAPRTFRFPADHGPHPDYKNEWWYYTGNLIGSDGRRFGFQLTFFRIAIHPHPLERPSHWATNQLYMAHFAVSDIQAQQFYSSQRLVRGAIGLAGSQGNPFQVWAADWHARQVGTEPFRQRLVAAHGDVAMDLVLAQTKPVVLQGDEGLSRKGEEPGDATYYYSLTRLDTSGSIRIGDQRFAVSGGSWMDREWGTSALAEDQVGWDWFALQLDDGRELMYYRLRNRDGGEDPLSTGSLVARDGSVTQLAPDQVRIQLRDYWRSPDTGVGYPSKWRVTIPGQKLQLTVTPYLEDQELEGIVRYWEGAVQVRGQAHGEPVRGVGYVELAGYE